MLEAVHANSRTMLEVPQLVLRDVGSEKQRGVLMWNWMWPMWPWKLSGLEFRFKDLHCLDFDERVEQC